MAKRWIEASAVKNECKRALERIEQKRNEDLEDAINNTINFHKMINEDRDKSFFGRFLGRYECTREEALEHLKQKDGLDLASEYRIITEIRYRDRERKIKNILNMVQNARFGEFVEIDEDEYKLIYGVNDD